MKPQTPPPIIPCDLSTLARVQLDARHTALLEQAKTSCGGNASWRHRKQAEALDLCRLSQLSRRILIQQLDLSVDIRVALLMRVTVPRLKDPKGPLEVADTARLGIIYREESMTLPQPGYSFVQILAPQPVWHANVSLDPMQVLCLGPKLPACIPLREIILMTYGALTMQNTQFNPYDFAGVLNPAAAQWFQKNLQVLPLSHEPFLQDRNPEL